MHATPSTFRHWMRCILVLALAVAAAGCSVKWVADYDDATFEEILRVGKKVDRFYGDLLEADASGRAYARFGSRYVELETDIRSLVTRNSARALNEESTRISEIILTLWVKYKDRHKQAGAYTDGNARPDRNRFVRLFAAAASAETAKKLSADDRNVDQDSK